MSEGRAEEGEEARVRVCEGVVVEGCGGGEGEEVELDEALLFILLGFWSRGI